ncbi:hypothetical protein BpHYR1_040874 [Brachionus plicatilis]|uniref:Uncharacterized protein n=1 Tax=Brachionus plicatilis TaxID=10195 RepID=A0A3M7P8K6_BRAPC|nr:hypothetical protein BpHYR1_040874 [Brachionus plicatilis]
MFTISKKGQPSKIRPALQRQLSKKSEDFAVNQDANPKPAALGPIFRNENAMNTIPSNQASQTVQIERNTSQWTYTNSA